MSAGENEQQHMVVVAGHLDVDPAAREAYLAGCAGAVRQARSTPGCLEFSLSADPLEPGRVVVLERWESRAAAAAFRGTGPDEQQGAAIRSASVAEYDVAAVRSLTG